jgi:hypothetical protein
LKARIHVNQHIIRSNRKSGLKEPTLTIKTSRKNIKASSVNIDGPCQIVYSPEKPLSCGATVWIETDTRHIQQVDHQEPQWDVDREVQEILGLGSD